MTCIVAVVDKTTSPHTVHMAGDSLSAHSSIAQVRADLKVFKLGEFACDYAAVGAGYYFALGAMYATKQGAASPPERLTVALEAAAELSCGLVST